MGEGEEGMQREKEVNCHEQLKQGRRLAMAGSTNRFRQSDPMVTERQTGRIGLYRAMYICYRTLKITLHSTEYVHV